MNAEQRHWRIAIIGCGAVAQQMYAQHLPQIPQLKITMVADLRPENAQAVATAVGCDTGTVEQAVASADMVIIATPPSSHAKLARLAIEAGCDVCIEKPFTTAAAAARELVDLAMRHERALYVAQFRRIYPKVLLARGLVASGLIGRIESIEMHEGARFSWEVSTDYITRDPFGGVLFDTGAHTLDMALFAAGLDEKVFAIAMDTVHRDRPEPAHEVDAICTLQAPGEEPVALRLQLSRVRNLANMIRLRGSRATIEFDVSHRGPIWLRTPGSRLAMMPETAIESDRHAFTLNFHQMTTMGAASMQAARFLGQIAILEAIHQHGKE